MNLELKNGSLLTSQTIPMRPPASGGEEEEPLERGRVVFTLTCYYEPMVDDPDCSHVTPQEGKKRTFDWGWHFDP